MTKKSAFSLEKEKKQNDWYDRKMNGNYEA